MTYALRERDEVGVLAALESGEYEAIATSGQSVADELVHLCIELGVFEALECLEVRREREGIPDELLLRTLAVLPFVEALGLSSAAGRLFKDAAILLQLGYEITQVQEGFNGRHNSAGTEDKTHKPCHVEVLRDELARIEPTSLALFRRRCVAELFRRKLVKGRVGAIDGSGLRTHHRLVGLLSVHEGQPLWLSWRVLTGSESEKGKEASVVRSLVEEVLEAGGSEAIEWLLMDALYADGPLLAWLEHGCGIHALVRLPEDRLLYEDAHGLAEHGLTQWQTHTDVRYVSGRKQARQVSVTMADQLTTWDSFAQAAGQYGCRQPSLSAVLIHSVDKADPSQVEDWGLVSTSPWGSAWGAYSLWRRRWLIENSGFRELKEAWHLEQAPWSHSNDDVVAARVCFTLIAYNVAQIAKTAQGRKLTDRGIRRLRHDLTATYGVSPVIVFTEHAFAVFHIEQVMSIAGLAPKHSLRPKPRPSPPALS
ncbi:MAG: transposase [Anaerolineae bacterium]